MYAKSRELTREFERDLASNSDYLVATQVLMGLSKGERWSSSRFSPSLDFSAVNLECLSTPLEAMCKISDINS